MTRRSCRLIGSAYGLEIVEVVTESPVFLYPAPPRRTQNVCTYRLLEDYTVGIAHSSLQN